MENASRYCPSVGLLLQEFGAELNHHAFDDAAAVCLVGLGQLLNGCYGAGLERKGSGLAYFFGFYI
jgi:hypothetical protein